MPFFKRKDKKASDRVLDLKARVDALRAADEASRTKPYSLEHFLEGDDVLTGRTLEDEYTPQGFDPESPAPRQTPVDESHFEVNLQAELEKYIQRQQQQQEERAAGFDSPSPAFEQKEPERPAASSDWDTPTDELAAQLRALNEAATEWPSTDAWSTEPEPKQEPQAFDPGPGWSNSPWPSEDEWASDDRKAV